jgi:serine/threonine protein kinase/tetratricopeptide (TPR) repeat protein
LNSARPTELIRFGVFELDLRSRELRKDGRSTGLPEQSIKVLQMLLATPGELVQREEIRLRLWPNDTVVEFDHSINTAVRKLRQALGDSADQPHYIETLARRGYRWIGALHAVVAEHAARDPRAPLEGAPPSQPEAGHLIGRRVSHYRVLEVLGGGGMGVVYKAEDLRLGRRVALKFLPEELAQNPTAMRRLEQEARAASALNHPNVCTIYEIAEYEGRPFIVMELLEGETLRELIHARAPGPLSLVKQIEIGIQVSDALAAAHAHGVIHRDIKPANVFVTRAGVAKILDFGVAKRSQETLSDEAQSSEEIVEEPEAPHGCDPGSNGASDALSLTRTGVTIGTAAYMSPEQARGEPLDGRTDLFSFGLVLYEMATGCAAFGAPTPELMREALLTREPASVRVLNPAVPEGLARIIAKALAKDRNQRYASAADMRSDLEKEAGALRRRVDAREGADVGAGTLHGVPRAASSFQRWRAGIGWQPAAVVGAALLVSGALLLPLVKGRPPILAVSDRVMVSDLLNTTGEPVFDGTLRQVVAVKLAESPYFNFVPESDITKSLKLLNRTATEPLLPPLAREVCRHAGAKLVVGGAIEAHEGRYHLSLVASNCATGVDVADESVHGFDEAQTLESLGNALRSLRLDLGEPADSLRRFDTPIGQATTKSLAALRAFTLGEDKRARGAESESLTDYKLATELDGDFAMAYARLAAVSRSLGQTDLADEYMRKAYERRGHLTERDKLYVQARYYSDTTHETQSEIESYSLWAQVYPNDFYPLNGLASAYIEIGRPDEAISAGLRSVALNPEHALPYATLARAYERTSHFDDAKAICERAVAEKLDAFWIHSVLYRIAFMDKDQRGMQQAVDWFKGKPQEGTINYYQAKAALSLGEVGRSREFFARARELATQRGLQEQSIAIRNGQAQFEAEMGLGSDAILSLDTVLRGSPDTGRHRVYAVLAVARSGDADRAEALLREMEAHPSAGTGLNEVLLPSIRAAIALDRGEPALAFQALQRAVPYDLGTESGGMTSYYRGLALLQMKSAKEAAAEFQKITNNRGVVAVDVYWPLAHLGLARDYAMTGDIDRSRVEYRDLLEFWKNADPDLKILQQAKSEYSRLSGAQ